MAPGAHVHFTVSPIPTVTPAGLKLFPPLPTVTFTVTGCRPVAVNVTGEPIRPATVACTDCAPAVDPNSWVTTAIPLMSVTLVGVETAPPPAVAAQCTDTPWTGLLFWSVAITRYGFGRVARTVSVWPSPEAAGVLASWVAPWIWAVALKLTGEPVRPVLAAVAVWAPAFAPRVQVAVAMPFASLLLCGVIDPLPAPGVHVTVTAATGLLLASRTITASGVARVWPAGPT